MLTFKCSSRPFVMIHQNYFCTTGSLALRTHSITRPPSSMSHSPRQDRLKVVIKSIGTDRFLKERLPVPRIVEPDEHSEVLDSLKDYLYLISNYL